MGYKLSCSVACGICSDQGSNLCPLHWQVDSSPLSYQGSPTLHIFIRKQRTRYLTYWYTSKPLHSLHGLRASGQAQQKAPGCWWRTREATSRVESSALHRELTRPRMGPDGRPLTTLIMDECISFFFQSSHE